MIKELGPQSSDRDGDPLYVPDGWSDTDTDMSGFEADFAEPTTNPFERALEKFNFIGKRQLAMINDIDRQRIELSMDDDMIVELKMDTELALKELIHALKEDKDDLFKTLSDLLERDERSRLRALRILMPHVKFLGSNYTDDMIPNQWNDADDIDDFVKRVVEMYWTESFLMDLENFLERSGLLIKDDTK